MASALSCMLLLSGREVQGHAPEGSGDSRDDQDLPTKYCHGGQLVALVSPAEQQIGAAPQLVC